MWKPEHRKKQTHSESYTNPFWEKKNNSNSTNYTPLYQLYFKTNITQI